MTDGPEHLDIDHVAAVAAPIQGLGGRLLCTSPL